MNFEMVKIESAFEKYCREKSRFLCIVVYENIRQLGIYKYDDVAFQFNKRKLTWFKKSFWKYYLRIGLGDYFNTVQGNNIYLCSNNVSATLDILHRNGIVLSDIAKPKKVHWCSLTDDLHNENKFLSLSNNNFYEWIEWMSYKSSNKEIQFAMTHGLIPNNALYDAFMMFQLIKYIRRQ